MSRTVAFASTSAIGASRRIAPWWKRDCGRSFHELHIVSTTMSAVVRLISLMIAAVRSVSSLVMLVALVEQHDLWFAREHDGELDH